MSKLFRWRCGRQAGGYEKMLLASARFPLPFDCYLLRFNVGSEVSPHIDEVKHGRHYRLNIVLRKAERGGEFRCDNVIFENSRIKFFRPDQSIHSVSPIIKGVRYVFSIGWVLN